MSQSERKNLVLGLISTKRQTVRPTPAKPGPQSTSDPDDEAAPEKTVSSAKLRSMMIKAESQDPIAGRRYRDKSKVTTGIYIRQEVHRKLKLLAAIERKKFNSYIEDAIDEYLEKIADRIPDIS